MNRFGQGVFVAVAAVAVTVAVLSSALVWGPHQCTWQFPRVIGCAVGSYESLAGGLIASAAAIFAGWLAWSAVQLQIEAEERRLAADRQEVEELLKEDVDYYAEGLASMWRVLDTIADDEETKTDSEQVQSLNYGIGCISEPNRIATSRRMIAVLGWSRRRRYDQMLDGLDEIRRFKDYINSETKHELLSAVKLLAGLLTTLNPDVEKYYDGFFWGSPKAWTLGYAIEVQAGLHREE